MAISVLLDDLITKLNYPEVWKCCH